MLTSERKSELSILFSTSCVEFTREGENVALRDGTV